MTRSYYIFEKFVSMLSVSLPGVKFHLHHLQAISSWWSYLISLNLCISLLAVANNNMYLIEMLVGLNMILHITFIAQSGI